jgi:hypothetical protein
LVSIARDEVVAHGPSHRSAVVSLSESQRQNASLSGVFATASHRSFSGKGAGHEIGVGGTHNP